MVPEDLSVVRVGLRVRAGGHDVPEAKIRARHRRLFALVADAVDAVDETVVYDNSRAKPAQPRASRCRLHPNAITRGGTAPLPVTPVGVTQTTATRAARWGGGDRDGACSLGQEPLATTDRSSTAMSSS
jgi:hypothetical protein